MTRRTRKIGVHMAIGAQRSQVVWLVARTTPHITGRSTVVGGVGAVGLSFFLRALVSAPDVPDLTFGAGAFNPVVFLGVLAATMVDPTVALRSE